MTWLRGQDHDGLLEGMMSESDYFESRELFAPLFPPSKGDSMSEPIKPALTAEEWRKRLPILHEDIMAGPAYHVQLESRYGEFYPVVQLRDYHRVAALALYGQPFGFTHEDVLRIRGAIDFAREMSGGLANEDALARLNNLADRISALLPEKA
jgi:hypothetical protein